MNGSTLSVVSAVVWRVGLGAVVGWGALGGGALGCSTPTYVNIPGQTNDVARNDPNGADVVDLMTKALAAGIDAEDGLDGVVYEVLLPAGSDQLTYQSVVLALGDGAITPDTLRESPVPSVRVVGVRVRNRKAEVDIIRPSSTGRPASTVHLFWYYVDGWQVERVRPQRLSVEQLGWDTPVEAPRPVPPSFDRPEPGGPADALDESAPLGYELAPEAEPVLEGVAEPDA